MAFDLSNLLTDAFRTALGLGPDDDAAEVFHETGRRARRAAKILPNRRRRGEKLPPHPLAMPVRPEIAETTALRDARLQAAWERTRDEGGTWVFPQAVEARRARRAAGRRQRAARRITRLAAA